MDKLLIMQNCSVLTLEVQKQSFLDVNEDLGELGRLLILMDKKGKELLLLRMLVSR